MNWLTKLLNKGKLNPYFVRLGSLLIDKGFPKSIAAIYDMGSCVYTDEHYRKLLSAIGTNSVAVFFANKQFDVLEDALEVFVVKYGADENILVVLFSPYDAFQNDEILHISSNYQLNLSVDVKQVYP